MVPSSVRLRPVALAALLFLPAVARAELPDHHGAIERDVKRKCARKFFGRQAKLCGIHRMLLVIKTCAATTPSLSQQSTSAKTRS